MKYTSVLASVATCLLLGFTPFAASQEESQEISMEEIRQLCAQWAEEDGLEEAEIAEYMESCIRDEAAAIGIEVSAGDAD